MQLDLKRLFSACAGCIGLAVLTPASSQAGTPDTDLWRDLNRSAFSTTSILSDLADIDKQVRAAQIAPLPGNSALVSSQPGAFQYDSEASRTSSAHKLSEEIRATQLLEKARAAEITEHPFWYARFWTHSPLAIPAFLLGGDHHALETPPTQFEKLTATSYMDTSYNSEAELRKFERTVSFGNLNQTEK
ncbi:MAG: hypothetical protein WAK31_19195 [Chthoniobacterales bacterium]